MENEPEPQGGVHLNMGFGTGAAAPPARPHADIAFKLVVVGDFGGAGEGRPRDISGEDISSLLATFGAAVEIEVPNHLGSTPPALAVRLPFSSLRDFDPKSIAARVPAIVKAEALAAALAEGRPDFEGLARDPALDRVRAALQPSSPAPARPSAPPPQDDDGALDRLLGLVDLPGAPPQPDPAQAAISAFLASTARPRQPPPAPRNGAGALLELQARAVAAHPAWLALEAAWRSLRLLFIARERRAATHLVLCDMRREGIPELLKSAAFSAALADQPEMTAILVLGAFGSSAADLDALERIAAAADRLAAPTLVSLAADFLGAPPEAIATLDAPGALLDAPGYAAWRGLRGREESGFLFAAWNDVLLRPAGEAAPALWGEPGVVLAAQILRSLARTGWPTEIEGAQTAMGGFDVAEVELRGGRAAAIPLRAPMDIGVARDLAGHGIACLVCRADRDQAWFTRAPSVHGAGAVVEENRKVMEGFDSLPFRFVSGSVEDALRANRALFAGAGSDAGTAAAMGRLLQDVLLTTGPGAAAQVTPAGDGRYDVMVRLGRNVMDGFSFSFEIAL
ncbi:type VI secretion system contractile sheath domain-containing protein [Xanthobacter sediminis]